MCIFIFFGRLFLDVLPFPLEQPFLVFFQLCTFQISNPLLTNSLKCTRIFSSFDPRKLDFPNPLSKVKFKSED